MSAAARSLAIYITENRGHTSCRSELDTSEEIVVCEDEIRSPPLRFVADRAFACRAAWASRKIRHPIYARIPASLLSHPHQRAARYRLSARRELLTGSVGRTRPLSPRPSYGRGTSFRSPPVRSALRPDRVAERFRRRDRRDLWIPHAMEQRIPAHPQRAYGRRSSTVFTCRRKPSTFACRGFRPSAVRDAALRLHRGGVGYYRDSNFVHVDVGRVRRW